MSIERRRRTSLWLVTWLYYGIEIYLIVFTHSSIVDKLLNFLTVGWTEEEEEEEKFVFFSLVEEDEEEKRIIYGADRKVKNGRALKKNISKIIILRLGSLFSFWFILFEFYQQLHHFFFFLVYELVKKEKSENPL